MSPLTALSGNRAQIHGVVCDLDQRIGKAARKLPIVMGAVRRCQHQDRGLDDRSADRVEQCAQRDGTALKANELEAAAFDRYNVLFEHACRVCGVSGMGAVVAESADRVLESELKEGTLVEAGNVGRPRAGVVRLGRFRRGLIFTGLAELAGTSLPRDESSRGAGHQREVRKPDAAALECGYRLRKALNLLAGVQRPARSRPGHMAVMPDPVDRADGPLHVVFVGRREDGGVGCELQLEQIDAVPELDEVLSKLFGRH